MCKSYKLLEKYPDHNHPMILTVIHFELRLNELFCLRWKEIIFEHGFITVISKEEGYTKNYKKRKIPLTVELTKCLQKMQRKNQWVFISKYGERYLSNRAGFEAEEVQIPQAELPGIYHGASSFSSDFCSSVRCHAKV